MILLVVAHQQKLKLYDLTGRGTPEKLKLYDLTGRGTPEKLKLYDLTGPVRSYNLSFCWCTTASKIV
jgi:hypothetical protein